MSSNPTGTIGGVPFEEHNQVNDLLGEALARADNSPHYDTGWQLDPDSAETIVAAARNWHTLTEGKRQVDGLWIKQQAEVNGEGWGYTIHRPATKVEVVDALTVTAETETEET